MSLIGYVIFKRSFSVGFSDVCCALKCSELIQNSHTANAFDRLLRARLCASLGEASANWRLSPSLCLGEVSEGRWERSGL